MLRLYSSPLDAKDQSCVADLRYIQSCVEDHARPVLAAYVVHLGFFELCQHVLAENFWRPDLFNDAATLELISTVIGMAADATDSNRRACEHVLSVDFQKDLFEMLRSEKLDPSKVKFGEQHCFIADCIMAILYNVIQVMLFSSNSFLFRYAANIVTFLRTVTVILLSRRCVLKLNTGQLVVPVVNRTAVDGRAFFDS